MKQTTLIVEIQEEYDGISFVPCAPRQLPPNDYHRCAWCLISGMDHMEPVSVTPKDLQITLRWTRNQVHRFLRIVSRQGFKTRVKIIQTYPTGLPHRVAVTYFWEQPNTSKPTTPHHHANRH
jgi:hypothetical protein